MAPKAPKSAMSPTRAEDYPEWYQQVIKSADMAENSPVRGCMVIKPWGYGIWENIQKDLDRRFKETGHENAYFPLFIPLSFLEKEAAHVDGFAKECAVVTHHRLEEKDGKLIPAGKLNEPLIIRPTSETIIGASFSKWVKSYRDLPVLINQWANVVRWEMRTRLFLRTAEFLWQEGHTVHANEAEAMEETLKMLDVYEAFSEECLAIPVIKGEKSDLERFPGAVRTYTIEAMMQDRKALQSGTTHYLGQNFAKASDITFMDKDDTLKHAYTSSWGVSTRLVGGMIMAHADDDGLRVPPRVAPKHVVILPVMPKPEQEESVLAFCEEIMQTIRTQSYHGDPVVVTTDKRDIQGGEKNWQWIKKGIPIRIEVGPRDLESRSMMVARRDQGHRDKESVSIDSIAIHVVNVLNEIQEHYYHQAKSYLKEHIRSDITDLEALTTFFTPENTEKPEIHGGFVLAKWCRQNTCEARLSELKASIRCIPIEQRGGQAPCIVCGAHAETDVYIAKSY